MVMESCYTWKYRTATFSAARYATARPSYPASLFKTVLAYHNAQSASGVLLDIGCGHGLIARAMSPHFDRVVAIDTSPDAKITLHQAGVEDLFFLADESIDMIVAGQSAHCSTTIWRGQNYTGFGNQRVRLPSGATRIMFSSDMNRPTALSTSFAMQMARVERGFQGMNVYWEQPGRNRLRNLLRDVQPPEKNWENIRRIVYDVTSDCAEMPHPEKAWMQKRINLGQLEAYVRTFSAFQGWRDAHPDIKSRAERGEGDLADFMMLRIVDSEPTWNIPGRDWRNAEADTIWGTFILLAKKR
ncbi:hypothetical protein E4U58_006212 [Claviceps cyperi]|nr:hypothetical protein E4U58_006212 [Claviceps cyperi]